MNEYEGWTIYCGSNGCPLQISVVGDGDSVPESEADFAAQVKACYTPWVNEDDVSWSCNRNRYSDYDNDTEFLYSNFMENYHIYFEGNVSDDDGNVTRYEWKFEIMELYQGREINWPDHYYEECDYSYYRGNETQAPKAYCSISLNYGPWNVSLRAKDDDGYWGPWSDPYSIFVSSQIRLQDIESDGSQIDEGEEIEFTAFISSGPDYGYYYGNGTQCCKTNYSKFTNYVWWSDIDGIIASGDISSDELWYGDEDGNDSHDHLSINHRPLP
jgi:hypothetical protein